MTSGLTSLRGRESFQIRTPLCFPLGGHNPAMHLTKHNEPVAMTTTWTKANQEATCGTPAPPGIELPETGILQ